MAEAAAWLQLTPIAQVFLAVPFLGEGVTLAQHASVLPGAAGRESGRSTPSGAAFAAPPGAAERL